MKIVFMEADTLGKDVDLSEFDKLGEVVKYPASKPAENAKRIEDADIIIVNKIPVNEELLKEAKNVKLVCVTATGTNIVDMPYVESRGIVVTNVKGYSTMSVAQHTFALLFYVYEKGLILLVETDKHFIICVLRNLHSHGAKVCNLY